MYTLKRYVTAFVKALKLTIAGKAIQPPAVRYPQLTEWVRQGEQLVDATLHIADIHGMEEVVRQQFTLIIDRRPMSMEVILQAVKHNMAREYPLLMKAQIDYNLMTLHAMNINDQYRVQQLVEAEGLAAEIQTAVEALYDHLQHIPQSDGQ